MGLFKDLAAACADLQDTYAGQKPLIEQNQANLAAHFQNNPNPDNFVREGSFAAGRAGYLAKAQNYSTGINGAKALIKKKIAVVEPLIAKAEAKVKPPLNPKYLVGKNADKIQFAKMNILSTKAALPDIKAFCG